MYFLINHKKKIIFGWSAKSGCSNLKRYFYCLGSSAKHFEQPVKVIIHQIKNPYEKAVFNFMWRFLGILGIGARAFLYTDKHTIKQEFARSHLLILLARNLVVKVITILFYNTSMLMKNSISNVNDFKGIHRGSGNYLDFDHTSYTKILFIRDPYKRVVSGFLNKYVQKHYPLEIRNLTFEKFVNELDKNNLKNIDKHHFTPQLSEAYQPSIAFDKIYDIENVDYDFIEKLFGKNLDTMLYCRRADIHGIRKPRNIDFNEKSHNFSTKQLCAMDPPPPYTCFYSKDIKEKVYKFYKKDFLFFEKHGFHYDVDLK